MRTIKFRAKRRVGSGWAYGQFYEQNDGAWLLNNETQSNCLIDKETLCQFTGLTDKNGKEIYEEDIISYHEFIDVFSVANGRVTEGEQETIGTIECPMGCMILNSSPIGRWDYFKEREEYDRPLYYMLDDSECYEVLGNTFDNPELKNKFGITRTGSIECNL